MGQRVSRGDFEWVYTEEPHATRRKQILAKYPQVKELMGHDPNLKWAMLLLLIFQFVTCILFQNFSWPILVILAYSVGGVVNHIMTLGIHEISHNLAFGNSRPLTNRFLGIIFNIPLGIPYSVSFKKYHMLHHRYQGDESMDMDLPSKLEGIAIMKSENDEKGLTYQNLCQKILLYWLKMRKNANDKDKVFNLELALRSSNQMRLADIVIERYRLNMDLVPAVFKEA